MKTKTQMVKELEGAVTLSQVKKFWNFRRVKGEKTERTHPINDLKPSGIKYLWFANLPWGWKPFLRLSLRRKRGVKSFSGFHDRMYLGSFLSAKEQRRAYRANNLAHDLTLGIVQEFRLDEYESRRIRRDLELVLRSVVSHTPAYLLEVRSALDLASDRMRENRQKKAALTKIVASMDRERSLAEADLKRFGCLSKVQFLAPVGVPIKKLKQARVLLQNQTLDQIIQRIEANEKDMPEARAKAFVESGLWHTLERRYQTAKTEGQKFHAQIRAMNEEFMCKVKGALSEMGGGKG